MWRQQRTFFPSGMADRSTSTLAMARTSADADILTRKSVQEPARISANFSLNPQCLTDVLHYYLPLHLHQGPIGDQLILPARRPPTLNCSLRPRRAQHTERPGHKVLKHFI